MENYGLNLQKEANEASEKDWKFGSASVPCLASIDAPFRENYLPTGEVQRGVEDFMDCATRGPLNTLETKFNWLYRNGKLNHSEWLQKNGYINDEQIEFSDAFVAINSGTTRQGNSLKAPLEAIRKQGLIPNKMLPKKANMNFEQYHDPARITGEMINLGKEFASKYIINYEKVYAENFEHLLISDMLNVAGFAWSVPVNGEYVKSDYKPNHAFMVYKPLYYAFDSYVDSVDGDFIKKLASNYSFHKYGYRVYISKENSPVVLRTRRINALARLLRIFRRRRMGGDMTSKQMANWITRESQNRIRFENKTKEKFKEIEDENRKIIGVISDGFAQYDRRLNGHDEYFEKVKKAINEFRKNMKKSPIEKKGFLSTIIEKFK